MTNFAHQVTGPSRLQSGGLLLVAFRRCAWASGREVGRQTPQPSPCICRRMTGVRCDIVHCLDTICAVGARPAEHSSLRRPEGRRRGELVPKIHQSCMSVARSCVCIACAPQLMCRPNLMCLAQEPSDAKPSEASGALKTDRVHVHCVVRLSVTYSRGAPSV